MEKSTITNNIYTGLKGELLQLVEQADMVVLDGRVIKHRDNHKIYVDITRDTSSLEVLSVKVKAKCERHKYITKGIDPILDSIKRNTNCTVNLDIV